MQTGAHCVQTNNAHCFSQEKMTQVYIQTVAYSWQLVSTIE